MGIQERLSEIEQEMARTQKNKKTEYHLGLLRARASKLRQELLVRKVDQKEDGFEVVKSGDARVVLLGLPSVGKSTLLSKLTTTSSVAADYEFTTLTCVAGKMHVQGAKIQVLDLPGIISGAASGRGKGKQVISIVRTSDLIVMVLDPRRKRDREILTCELGKVGIRINKKRPDVSLSITSSGGISISKTVELSKITESEIRAILKGYKISNCRVVVREDISSEDFVDVVSKGSVYIKCVYCYNKVDELSLEQLDDLDLRKGIAISSAKEWNLEGLKSLVFDTLDLKRVYTKKKGEKPDFANPVVLRERHKVEDLCAEIHREFVDMFKFALVWGGSAKHSPQKVGLGHELCDEDVVQIHLI